MNIHVMATADGDVLWVRSGSPGSAHDIAARRSQAMAELAPFISRHTRRDGSRRLAVLGDKGYVGITTPTKRRKGVNLTSMR